MDTRRSDVEALIREKYDGDRGADMAEDLARLMRGEPLAYIIGWIPFLGVRVHLDSRPLIPRPETEWWTERLIARIKEKGATRVLDLCAGSGAIGLAVLSHTDAEVSFGELVAAHAPLIEKNLWENGLDTSRARISIGDLFKPFAGETFDIIATNPPYIPRERALEESVTKYEPEEALYAGTTGLDLIERIIKDARAHLAPGGELWMEADIENIEEARARMEAKGFVAEILTDPYGRPRLVVGH